MGAVFSAFFAGAEVVWIISLMARRTSMTPVPPTASRLARKRYAWPNAGTQRLVGNFPQAFSHIALVNTAYNIASATKPCEQRSGNRRLEQRTG
jgi:hypothetical protein